MAKELPILPSSAQPAEGAAAEAVIYSRVFCKNENAPPLRLLVTGLLYFAAIGAGALALFSLAAIAFGA